LLLLLLLLLLLSINNSISSFAETILCWFSRWANWDFWASECL
jgi:hypothetical protein